MIDKILNRHGFWAAKQQAVHFPVFSLLARACGGLGCFYRLGVNRFQRKLAQHIPDPSRLDIFLVDLRHGFTEVAARKRTLIISKLNQRELRVVIPLYSAAFDAHNDSGLGSWRLTLCRNGWSRLPTLKRVTQVLSLPLQKPVFVFCGA